MLHHPGVQGFQRGIPVRQAMAGGGNKTLGELDFIWQRDGLQTNDGWEHWELAVKFYIRCGEELDTYLGPNRRDSLQRKWQRFIEHQIPLGSGIEGRDALANLAHPIPKTAELSSRILLKGWLFHPLRDGKIDLFSATPISAQHAAGWWTSLQELDLSPHSRSSRYYLLPKARWLAPCRLNGASGASGELLSAPELSKKLPHIVGRQQQTQLIAEMQRDLEGHWSEVSRGFVVPNDWDADTDLPPSIP